MMDLRPTRATLVMTAVLLGCGGSVETGTVQDGGSDASAADAKAETAPVDTGTTLTAACAAAGGAYCSANRWELCPVGFEPSDKSDGHFGCGMIEGWCCVAAPTSTCSASGKGNCVPGGCTGCWTKVTDTSLTCEDGRGCCIDACD